jgi:antitoxin component YwqK of YwqJK toxin-antitoxin module
VQSKKEKIYYDSGELKAEGLVESDKKEGVWKVYDKHGDIAEKLRFDGGKLNHREVYINNNLAISEELKDSIRNGELKLYYEDGSIKKLYTFKEGKQDGVGKTYFPNHNLELQYNYKDSFQLDYIQYYGNGEVFIKADTFGKGVMHFYDSLGKKDMDILFEQDLPVDTLKIY